MLKKWLEYAKLIPAGIQNIDKFIEAKITEVKLANGNLPEDQIEEIVRRRLICEGCEFNSVNAKKLHSYHTERQDLHCSFCKCEITTRTACLGCTCGIESYNRNHPNSPKELKWTNYKTKNQ